jgi:hypothetical protein
LGCALTLTMSQVAWLHARADDVTAVLDAHFSGAGPPPPWAGTSAAIAQLLELFGDGEKVTVRQAKHALTASKGSFDGA